MAIVKTYGIDVSYHQGVIDWQTVKAAGVEWIILRAGYGFRTVDTQFVNNITGAIAAGFDKIGVYWFCYSHNTDDVEIEVASCLAALEPYREHINLPVFFDFETASYTYVQNTYGVNLTAAEIRGLATAWCNAVTASGYSAGIYSNKNDGERWFKNDNDIYLWQELNCEFWYARYGANNETSLFITPAFEATALSEHPETDVLQYSDVGVIDGINSQRVDLNIRYTEEADPPTPPTPPIPPEPPTPEPPTPPTPEPSYVPIPSDMSGIEYIEVRNSEREVIGIIDNFSSLIWHSVYYGVGDFEIYVRATPEILSLLTIGKWITRPDNAEIGIVETVNITNNINDGLMIAATGRFAKSILDRRLIYHLLTDHTNKATTLSGNVETNIRALVSDNAINCAFDGSRDIPILELGASAGIPEIIVDGNGNATRKQVSYANLLAYTDSVLEEYSLGSTIKLDYSTLKLQYIVKKGADRSVTNTDGNLPVIFSQEYDNLLESNYSYDTVASKNIALIGGAGEGLERFYSEYGGMRIGLARRETWVDASSLNRTYKDDYDVEQTYSDADYDAMLLALGKQEIATHTDIESFAGAIDVENGNYIYNRDFVIGDIVTIQDNRIGKYINARIVEVTEVQDENGYIIEPKYQS